MANCKLCEGPDALPSNGICATCSVKLGIRPMPPSRRPPVPCARCNGMRFIRCVPREHSVAHRQDWNLPDIAPMTLTQPIDRAAKFFGGVSVDPTELSKGRGVLETHTCAKCGFVEWYCQDPENVPIGPEYMTELVDLTSENPYR